jgi:hypothetical protein
MWKLFPKTFEILENISIFAEISYRIICASAFIADSTEEKSFEPYERT